MQRYQQFHRAIHVTVIAIVASFSHVALADDWPAYRGAHGDGMARVESVFPTSGEFGLEVSWKKTIGSGYSGIAVAEGIAVTGFSDGTKDLLVAFDMKTGVERWRFVIEDTYLGHDGSHTGPIATPTIADGRVYGLGAWGRLFALSVKDGSLAWSTHLKDDHGATKPHYGFSTSPFVRGGVLIIQGGAKDAALTGFDAKTGKLLWKSGEDAADYQSPIDYTDGGVELMLAPGKKNLFAFAPKTGEIAWQFEHNGVGAIGAASLSAVPTGGGDIFLSNKRDASTVFSVSGSAESFKAETMWESKSIRNSYNVPVYHAGYIYAFSSRFLTCIDAKTGKAAWRSRAPGDGFLILVDEHLVVVTKKTGEVHIIPATSEGFASVTSASVLSDVAWAHPSFAEGAIFVRSMGEIARVDILKGSASVASAKPSDESGTGKFARFLSQVESSHKKQAVVDAFMKMIEQFPLTEGNTVHFLYQGKGSDLAVGSDLFGARQERSMTRVADTNLFYYSAKLERDTRVNYLFIRDYEDHLVDPRTSRRTKSKVYGREMGFNFGGEAMDMSWFAMPGWKAPTFFATPDSGKKGRIESREFQSKIIESAKISLEVYLPARYDLTKAKYPVAYIFGGKQAMDAGNVPRALDNLIGKSVRPLIAVFFNLPERISPEEISEMFATELIPFIDKNFQTQATRDARACIGAGFDGVAAFDNAFAHADLVGKAGALSMFMTLASMKKSIEANSSTVSEQPMQLYMDWGKYDLRSPDEAWDSVTTNREFVDYLRDRGFNPQGGELNEGTGWSSWKNRTEALFSALFPNTSD